MNFIKFVFIILILFFLGAHLNYKALEKVEYFKIEKVTINTTYKGIVKTKNSATLSFQTQGQIIYLPYTNGDFVKKGEVIAKLDGVFYQIQKDEEMAKMQEYIVLKNKQKRYYDRLDVLHKEGAISDNDWESAYFELKALDAQIKLQKEKIKYIDKEISYNSIIAPFDGYIVNKYNNPGSYTKMAAPVVDLISSDGFQIEFIIGENMVNKLFVGDVAEVEINNIKINGKVSHISQSSINSGGYLIKISIDVLKDIKEGMSADIKMLSEKEKCIIVPLEAIFEDETNKYVYKISEIHNNTGKIEKIKITTGKIIGDKILVLNGLKEGDLILKNFALNMDNKKVSL